MRKPVLTVLSLMLLASLVLTSCAVPTPQVVEKVVKETVQVEVEKVVEKTVRGREGRGCHGGTDHGPGC